MQASELLKGRRFKGCSISTLAKYTAVIKGVQFDWMTGRLVLNIRIEEMNGKTMELPFSSDCDPDEWMEWVD